MAEGKEIPVKPGIPESGKETVVSTPQISQIKTEIRIEVLDQLVSHVDPKGTALVECRLQFWNNETNNPIEGKYIFAYNERGRCEYHAMTDIDGRADFKFVMNIDEQSQQVHFSSAALGAERMHVFFLADNSNAETKREIDAILLRKMFNEDSKAVLERFNDKEAIRAFKIKYQGRVPEEWMKDLSEAIKAMRKEEEDRKTRVICTRDYYTEYGYFQRYKVWIGDSAVYGNRLINRAGIFISSAQFEDINPLRKSKEHDPTKSKMWEVTYQGRNFIMNSKGQFCNESGEAIKTKNRDSEGFPLPDITP